MQPHGDGHRPLAGQMHGGGAPTKRDGKGEGPVLDRAGVPGRQRRWHRSLRSHSQRFWKAPPRLLDLR